MNKQSYYKLAAISTKLAALRKMGSTIMGLDGRGGGLMGNNPNTVLPAIGIPQPEELTEDPENLYMNSSPTINITGYGSAVQRTNSNAANRSISAPPTDVSAKETNYDNPFNAAWIAAEQANSPEAVSASGSNNPVEVNPPSSGRITPNPNILNKPITYDGRIYSQQQAADALVNRWLSETYGPNGRYPGKKPHPQAKIIMRNRAKALVDSADGATLDDAWINAQPSNGDLNKRENWGVTAPKPKENPVQEAAIENPAPKPVNTFEQQQKWWENRYETQGANMSPSSPQATNDRNEFNAKFGNGAYIRYMEQCNAQGIQPYGKYSTDYIKNNLNYRKNNNPVIEPIQPVGQSTPKSTTTPKTTVAPASTNNSSTPGKAQKSAY